MANKLGIIGLPNAIGATGVTIAAGTTAAAGMPLANLATEEPSDLCRLVTVDPAKTWWQFTLPAPLGDGSISYWPIRGLGLVNHNLENASQYRVVVGVSGNQILYENLAPTGVDSSSGFTGAAADVDDDPFAPDGVAGVLATTNDYVTFNFNTPAQRVVGTDTHLLVIRAKGQISTCLFTTAVLESGTTRITVGSAQSLGTDYRNYVFAFDPTTVTNLANFQVKITHNGASGKTISIDSVRWVAEVTTATPAGDSGWLTVPSSQGDALFGSTLSDEIGAEPTRTLGHLFTVDKNGNVVEIHVRNLRTESLMDYEACSAASGYTQAGVAVAGPALQPTYAPALGDVLQVRDLSSSGLTLGGAGYGSSRRRRRVTSVQLRALSAAEGWGLFERLDWQRGTRGAVLISLFPEGTDASLRLGTFWATLEEPSALASSQARSRFAKNYTFVEKL